MYFQGFCSATQQEPLAVWSNIEGTEIEIKIILEDCLGLAQF